MFEPPHDKTNKMTVRPAKTQMSLGICPVWSETSLCAQLVAKGPSFLHAHSEDSDQIGWMPRLIWVFAGRTCHFVGFVMRRFVYILGYTQTSDTFYWKTLPHCLYRSVVGFHNSFFLAHLSRRLTVYHWSVVRPSSSTLSNLNISEVSRPILIKFYVSHHWGGRKAT